SDSSCNATGKTLATQRNRGRFDGSPLRQVCATLISSHTSGERQSFEIRMGVLAPAMLSAPDQALNDYSCACKLLVLKEVVGANGFEPSTSWSRTRHLNPINALFGVAYGTRSVISPLSVVPRLYLDFWGDAVIPIAPAESVCLLSLAAQRTTYGKISEHR